MLYMDGQAVCQGFKCSRWRGQWGARRDVEICGARGDLQKVKYIKEP